MYKKKNLCLTPNIEWHLKLVGSEVKSERKGMLEQVVANIPL